MKALQDLSNGLKTWRENTQITLEGGGKILGPSRLMSPRSRSLTPLPPWSPGPGACAACPADLRLAWVLCWVCLCQVVLNRWPSTRRRQDTRGNGAWKRSMRLGPKDTWSGRSLPASRRERRKVRAALVLFQLVAGHCWGRISVHSMYKPGSETQRTDLHRVRRTLCRGGNSQR